MDADEKVPIFMILSAFPIETFRMGLAQMIKFLVLFFVRCNGGLNLFAKGVKGKHFWHFGDKTLQLFIIRYFEALTKTNIFAQKGDLC